MSETKQSGFELQKSLDTAAKVSSIPLFKNFLLLEAEKYLERGLKDNAIFCLTEALNGSARKYMFKNSINIDNLQTLIDEIARKSSDGDVHKDSYYHNQLVKQVKELPAEWVVMQITKRYNHQCSMLKHSDLVGEDTGFFVTLLKYPRMHLNKGRPILIAVEPVATEMYRDHDKLIDTVSEGLKYDKENDSMQARKQHWTKVKDMEENLKKCLENSKEHFLPWMVLLTGEFAHEDDKKYETRIFKKVDDFCAKHKFLTETQILLSLIARRIDLVSKKDTYRYLCSIEEDLETIKIMYAFLTELMPTALSNFEYPHPCMMIIEEYMDLIFWEMINIHQGICRLVNLEILCTLSQRYRDDIRNGYLEVNTAKGYAMINPNDNLPAMEKRMTEFFDACLPDTYKKSKNPSTEEVIQALTSTNIFIYCGHGSGLHHVKGDFLTFHTINCVSFLFGCGSVQLISTGMWSEMKGAHVPYHVSLCPAVIGMLLTVTDYETDCTAATILSRWIKGKATWKSVKKENWDHHMKEKTHDVLMNKFSTLEPNLLKILTDLRLESAGVFTLRHIVTLCVRGLPVRSV